MDEFINSIFYLNNQEKKQVIEFILEEFTINQSEACKMANINNTQLNALKHNKRLLPIYEYGTGSKRHKIYFKEDVENYATDLRYVRRHRNKTYY